MCRTLVMIISNVKRQIVDELHRPARRNFLRRKTIIKGYGDLWQIDLAEMKSYAKKNRSFRYILVVIDCYSKYVWTRAVKSKTAVEVVNAMSDIIQEANYTPKNIQSDQGSEFYNKPFSALMKLHNINHYSTYSTKKAAIVERVIRTLKNYLYKEFSLRGSHKWLKVLPDVVKKYNNTLHRTIGMKPADVGPHTQIAALKSSSRKIAPSKFKFRVGDVVRISIYKGVFDRGFTTSWSAELFKVDKVNVTSPPTYLLKDMEGAPIKGCFYEAELQRTRHPDTYLVEKVLRRRRQQQTGSSKAYVKWLGFSNKHNSWINEDDIV